MPAVGLIMGFILGLMLIGGDRRLSMVVIFGLWAVHVGCLWSAVSQMGCLSSQTVDHAQQ